MTKFLNNINLEAANDIQFKTTAGSNAGKISQTGDDLVISNAVGDILLGNGSDDVYIGDGTNTVDIRFEQNMAIFADSSSTKNLTLGGTNTNLVLESPSISGTMTLGATTINNKLTFTSATGYILFDHEPTNDTGEYTTEVPWIKFDHNGTEKTILSRISENGAIQLGHDDTVLITAGDVGDVMKTNWGATNEAVVLAAENGFYAYGFPENTTTWANRNEFVFYSASATAADNGLYIGDGGNTQFIDVNRNLKNIGTITNSGAIISSGDITITNNYPRLLLTDTDHNDDWSIINSNGDFWIYNETDSKEYFRADEDSEAMQLGDGINMTYDAIGTSNSGTVVRGGFLNPAAEANMVHFPHLINDLAGFNKWSNGTITVSGLYGTRSGSSGSYSYSNAIDANNSGWANAFDSHSSTAGSWYSDNGTDGVYQHGTDTPGVITLEWPNEATYSLWVGIVFGSGSFTATYVKIEAYRGGAWQTLCEITDNTDQVVLRQVSSNSGTGAATTKLRYTLGGSVNGSYFRIHSLYMANYRAGDNNLNNTGTDTTRGVNFLERYKDGYLHGHLRPGADDTYDLGSSSYEWKNAYFDGTVNADGLDVDGNADISGNLTLSGTYPRILLTDSNSNDDYSIINDNGTFIVYNDTDSSTAFAIAGNNNATFYGSVTATSLDINGNADISGDLTGVDTLTATTFSGDLNGTINSSTTATTQSASNNSTKVATTAYVDTAVSNLVDTAPSNLNTLNELAAALGDDVNFSTTVTDSIATKLAKSGDTMTGQLLINHDNGLRLGDTANASTARTTLTSFNSAGNSQMKIKGGNFVHRVNFETSKNDFNYAYLNSSYNGSDTSLVLNKSNSDTTGTAATTTISTGTSTFAGDVVATDGSDTSTLSETGLTLSRSNSYIQSNADNSDTLNIGQSSVRWGHVKVDSATFKVLNGGTERLGIDSSGNATFTGTLTVGADDTGHDVTFYGATSGKKMHWDEDSNGGRLNLNGGADLYINQGHMHMSQGSYYFKNASTGTQRHGFVADEEYAFEGVNLRIQATQKFYLDGGSDTYITENAANNLQFVVGDNEKLVLGNSSATINSHLKWTDNYQIQLGTDADLQWLHTGTHMYMDNKTGDMVFRQKKENGDIIFQGNDGGGNNTSVNITALTLDMSEAGKATFNGEVEAASLDINGDADISGSLDVGAVNADGNIAVVKNSAMVRVSESGGADVRMVAGGSTGYIGTYNNNSLQILQNNGAAITIDTSRNSTFAGDVQAPGIYVGSTNTSYDFYNNGTSYLNGAATVDDNLTVNGNIVVSGTVDGVDIAAFKTAFDNQTDNNTFRTIEVDSSGNDSADSTLTATETLRFKKGSNVSIDESDGVITISSTDTNTTYSVGDGGLTQKNFTTTLKNKLDGIESNATADQTAAEILTAIKTVDGAGTGLDADTVDGYQAANLLDRANHTGTQAYSTLTGTPTTISSTQATKLSNITVTSGVDLDEVASNAEGSVQASTTSTISGAKTFSAATAFTNTTNSTSKTTGAIKLSGGMGIAKTLNVGEDVVAYASSDERYKDNLQAITNPIDKVKSLTGYTFTWNDKHEQFNGNNDIGVVAQEVEKILPEIVDTRDNGYKAVKYEKMVALLIEAVKDQQEQIDELKQRLDGCSC